ncbi:MAG: hypothetical protein WAO20_08185 [Acidobacteriota bacterium]
MKRKQPAIFAILLCSLFFASLFAQQWKLVGRIVSDVSKGETAIVFQSEAPVVAGKAILIESRDGTLRVTYQVRHVYDDTILLEEPLKEAFTAGSRLYQ